MLQKSGIDENFTLVAQQYLNSRKSIHERTISIIQQYCFKYCLTKQLKYCSMFE